MLLRTDSRFGLSAGAACRVVLVVAVLASALPAGAQTEVPSPTPVPEPTPITASEIPARISELRATLRDDETAAEPDADVTSISEALPEELDRITELNTRIEPLLETTGPSEVLQDVLADADSIEGRLSKWLDTLAKRTAELDEILANLKSNGKLWQLTLDDAGSADFPPALVQQIRDSLRLVRDAEKRIGDRRAEVLTLQVQVAEQRGQMRVDQEQLRAEIEDRQLNMWRIDSPPLWRAFGGRPADRDIGDQLTGTSRKNAEAISNYIKENPERFILHLAAFTVLLALFFRLGRRAGLWARTDASLTATAALLQRPVASSLLVTIVVFGGWIHPEGPTALLNVLAFILLMTMLRLLPRLMRREMLPAVTMLVLLVCLYLLVELIPGAYLLDRLGKLVLAVLGTAACVWVLRRARRLEPPRTGPWFRAGQLLVGLAAVAFSVSALANIVGCVALASLFAMATLNSVYDAIVLWVTITVLLGAVTVALRTPTARFLLTVRYHDDKIRAVVFRVIRVVAVLSWIAMALHDFGIFNDVDKLVRKTIFYKVAVGNFAISISSVMAFVLVIWAAEKIAQFGAFILNDDVLPRIDLPRGAGPAITKMSRYVVLSVGVLIAVSAAGLDLSQLTFIIGALGVGIGFGLQNVVNNFVSGLILLFERPVNVGDKIQVGDLGGVVVDIGIRASVVRTWQGADVIVPNAALISDNLINWTLTDTHRRMEIPFGVAYGSSPEQVIELILEVARGHTEIISNPEPAVIFNGFGDSSLDFEVRAWTEGDYVAVASDLRIGINRALADAGIEIPFPQRDLHLRSVDHGVAERLAGNRPKEPIGIERDASPNDSEAPSDAGDSRDETV